MKLFRHGAIGAERPGALDAQGQMRDLSLLIADFTPDWMAPAKLNALKAIDLTRLPLVAPGTRLAGHELARFENAMYCAPGRNPL